MALSFNGSSYLTVAGAAPPAPPFTLAAWAKPPANANGYLVAVGNASGTMLAGLYFRLQTNRVVVNTGVNGVGTRTDGAPWSAGVWQHVMAVCQADGSVTIFQSGVQTGASGPMAAPVTMTEFYIGARPPSNIPLNSEIADAAVWGEALGAHAIAALAQGFSPLCLTQHAEHLLAYNNLIRSGDRPMVGPPASTVGTLAAAAHPRVIFPSPQFYRATTRRVFPRLAAADHATPGSAAALQHGPGSAAALCRSA